MLIFFIPKLILISKHRRCFCFSVQHLPPPLCVQFPNSARVLGCRLYALVLLTRVSVHGLSLHCRLLPTATPTLEHRPLSTSWYINRVHVNEAAFKSNVSIFLNSFWCLILCKSSVIFVYLYFIFPQIYSTFTTSWKRFSLLLKQALANLLWVRPDSPAAVWGTGLQPIYPTINWQNNWNQTDFLHFKHISSMFCNSCPEGVKRRPTDQQINKQVIHKVWSYIKYDVFINGFTFTLNLLLLFYNSIFPVLYGLMGFPNFMLQLLWV